MMPVRELTFSREDYCNVLEKLYKKHHDDPFVVANYDWGTKGQSYENQIKDAREIVRMCPNWSK